MKKFVTWNQFASMARAALATGLVLVFAGCERGEVKVYQVPKESAAPAQSSMPTMPTMAGGEAPASAPLTWKLPAGWLEVKPGPMRLAQFAAAGGDGKKAEVSIVLMGGPAGGELSNVNRWRGQLSLLPVTAEEVAQLGEKAETAGAETKLYDMAGTTPAGGAARILVTSLARGDESWFFKMTGEDAVVVQLKPAFMEFLKSLKFGATASAPEPSATLPTGHPPMGGVVTQSPSVEATKPTWQIPANWSEVPATAMLLAKFSVGQDAARAEISVSSFDGVVGGLTANVNRWRGQISLAPIDDAAVNQAVTAVEVSGAQASLVDISGTDAKTGLPTRLIGVAVPHAGRTWFFKMLGDEKVVARERDAFLKFLQTIKLPHAA